MLHLDVAGDRAELFLNVLNSFHKEDIELVEHNRPLSIMPLSIMVISH